MFLEALCLNAIDMKVKVIVETGKDLFSCFMSGADNLDFSIIGTGKTARKSIEDFKLALGEMKSYYEEIGKDFPEMAKPFGKRPIDYLRLPSTNELLSAIVRKSHISENQLVISKQGSAENGGGTWMHEDEGNKLLFSIAYLKKLRTFAVRNILKGGEVRKTLWAIFMSATKHIRFHAPVSSVNATTAFEVLRNGSAWNRSLISTKIYFEQTF